MLTVVLTVVASGCAFGGGVAGRPTEEPVGYGAVVSGALLAGRSTEPARSCAASLPDTWIDAASPVAAAVAISAATFRCADVVTLAPLEDAAAAAAGEAHATRSGGPLLLVARGEVSPEALDEIARLRPRLVAAIGLPGVSSAQLGHFPVTHLSGGQAASQSEPPGGAGLWVIDRAASALGPVVRAAAAGAGGEVLEVSETDLRETGERARRRLAAAAGGPLAVVGLTADARWQAEVVAAGMELPGGGQTLFPHRRLVAFYGHPGSSGLGVLGEQGPEAALDRLRDQLRGYDRDGVPVVPAFEIIATVADSYAGEDGDYSAEASIDHLRPWIDLAADEGVYVILDLQPGRTDFLTQAKLFEELLREPHVGLALDPEWRLEPDEFHLQQIGSVDAAEVNTVVEWLAGIVREEHLPQKLLLLHQFEGTMITNRYKIERPSELAVLIQADGFGPADVKLGAFQRLTDRVDAGQFWWGWKNFYDEDPQMYNARQVLELDPTVYYVSFQ
jgi:hypothetical protein